MASLRLNRDLESLDRLVTRTLPAIDDTRRALGEALRREESFMMKMRSTARRRPWLVPACAAAAVAILLMVPVSYEVTSAWAVRVRLDGADVTRERLAGMAADFGRAVGAEHVAMSFQPEGGELLARVEGAGPEGHGDGASIGASAGGGSARRASIEAAARSFVTGLSRRGISADLTLTPVRSLVTRQLYAMGLTGLRSLDIRRQGRPATEIERDIRDQLRASGLDGARVSYTESKGCSRIQIVTGGAASFGAGGDGIEVALICTMDQDCSATCAKTCPPSACPPGGGARAGHLDVRVDGEKAGFVCTAEARLASTAGLGDREIAAALAERFRAQGVEAEVVVQGGEVVEVNPVCATR